MQRRRPGITIFNEALAIVLNNYFTKGWEPNPNPIAMWVHAKASNKVERLVLFESRTD